jgi:hypothetical protein
MRAMMGILSVVIVVVGVVAVVYLVMENNRNDNVTPTTQIEFPDMTAPNIDAPDVTTPDLTPDTGINRGTDVDINAPANPDTSIDRRDEGVGGRAPEPVGSR